MENGRAKRVLLPRQPAWAGLVFWGSNLLHEVINHTLCSVPSGHSPEISDSILDFPQGDTALTCMGSYWRPNPHNGFLTPREKVLRDGEIPCKTWPGKQSLPWAKLLWGQEESEWSHCCNIIRGMTPPHPKAGPLGRNTFHIYMKKKTTQIVLLH